MDPEIAPLEVAVLKLLTLGDHPILRVLRLQLPLLRLDSRTLTGTGFYTNFLLTHSAPTAPVRQSRAAFGDVGATIAGLQYGAGFLLWLKDGRIHQLEGYSYEEKWPEHIESFNLEYFDSSRTKFMAELTKIARLDSARSVGLR